MSTERFFTPRLELVPQTVEQARAMVEVLSPEDRKHVSADWLARLNDSPDVWTLGFMLVLRSSGAVIGKGGFKGPPSTEGMVEIAYGVDSDQQGKGYATEAAHALASFAFERGLVRVVRAHTHSTKKTLRHEFLPRAASITWATCLIRKTVLSGAGRNVWKQNRETGWSEALSVVSGLRKALDIEPTLSAFAPVSRWSHRTVPEDCDLESCLVRISFLGLID